MMCNTTERLFKLDMGFERFILKYELYELSFLGLIHLAYAMKISGIG